MMPETVDQLVLENEELRRRLEEVEEVLRALRAGEVDAVLMGEDREQVYTLETADKPYRLLVEQMPYGAATLTPEGTIIYCNRRFTDLLRRPLQHLLGKPCLDFIAPDSQAHFAGLLHEGQTREVQGEVNLLRADGTHVPAYLGVSALTEGALGLCLVITDLTEQEAHKKAERFASRMARLQQVTAALSGAFSVQQVAKAMITQTRAALGASAAWVAVLNDERTEFLCMRDAGFAPHETATWARLPANAASPMADAVRLAKPLILETPAQRAARYPAALPVAAMEDAALVALPLLVQRRALGALQLSFDTAQSFTEDDLSYMYTIGQQCAQALDRAKLYDAEHQAREQAEREVAQRRLIELALRQSEDRFRVALKNSPIFVCTADRELRYTWIYNPLWGFAPEQMLGRRDDELFSPEAAAELTAFKKRVLDTGMGDRREIGLPLLDQVRFYDLTAEPLRDDAGEAVGLTVAAMEITDRKRAEEALREADRRKDEFLATLAHELRNPLAPILNALHLIQLGGAGEADRRWAWDLIQRQTQQLVRLVDDLLDVSRITRGKVQLRKAPVALDAILQRAVESSQPLISAGRHELTVQVPEEPIPVYADPARLGQAFTNLLNNAAKYMEPGGHIWLSAERAGEEAVVRVRDTGVGIAPEMLPKVFNLFTQIDRSLDRAQGGLGIGLALVQSLVQRHRGTVTAHSEGLGKGSEFVVRLPVFAEPLEEKSDDAVPHLTSDGPSLRVLIVDDNREAAQALLMLLQCLGHEASIAHGGQEALDAARTHRPDVVLLDLGLPGMDGYEVCRRLRAAAPEQPTILVALTGYGHEDAKRRCEEAGFQAHLTKPVSIEELQGLLKRMKDEG